MKKFLLLMAGILLMFLGIWLGHKLGLENDYIIIALAGEILTAYVFLTLDLKNEAMFVLAGVLLMGGILIGGVSV